VDYVAVGQMIDQGADERVLLFVKLPEGQKLTPEFEARIKKEMRARRSPRHAPAKVRLVS
jgi:acetoacetyl-CoA synthetase